MNGALTAAWLCLFSTVCFGWRALHPLQGAPSPEWCALAVAFTLPTAIVALALGMK